MRQATRRRLDALETAAGVTNRAPRLGDSTSTTDWHAVLEQRDADRVVGIPLERRADLDLQETLRRYPHPADREQILFWHQVRLDNIRQWEQLGP